MKPHSDTPVDRHTLQVRLLSERLAVWVYKAKVSPIDIKQREMIAGFMLEQFDIRAKRETDRPVFAAPELDYSLGTGKAFSYLKPNGKPGEPDLMRGEHLESIADIPLEPKTVEQKSAPDVTSDDEICETCNGKTRVCFTCNLPEGTCNHVRFGFVVCPACNGTGKET